MTAEHIMDIPTRNELPDPSAYAREMVLWARKASINGRGNKGIYKDLNSRSVAVVGEDEAGRKVFDVQFPGNVTVGTEKEALRVLNAAKKIWDTRLHDAVVTRTITLDQYERIKQEQGGPYIHLDGTTQAFSKGSRRENTGVFFNSGLPTNASVVEPVRGRLSSTARLLTVGGTTMILATACTVPAITRTPVPTQEVKITPQVENLPLTADKAIEIINTEWGIGTPVFEGSTEFKVDSVTVDVINTYSQIDASGNILNPQIKRTGHLANLVNENGEQETLPLLIEYDENTGNNRVFGLARDAQNPNEFYFVTHNNGLVVRTELKLVTTEEDGGLSLSIFNTDTGNSTLLALTPKDPSVPTVAPTAIPGSIQWIDRLVGLISGAETAYAGDEAAAATTTPTTTSTSEPTNTVEPTVTPTKTPVPTKTEVPEPTPVPDAYYLSMPSLNRDEYSDSTYRQYGQDVQSRVVDTIPGLEIFAAGTTKITYLGREDKSTEHPKGVLVFGFTTGGTSYVFKTPYADIDGSGNAVTPININGLIPGNLYSVEFVGIISPVKSDIIAGNPNEDIYKNLKPVEESDLKNFFKGLGFLGSQSQVVDMSEYLVTYKVNLSPN